MPGIVFATGSLQDLSQEKSPPWTLTVFLGTCMSKCAVSDSCSGPSAVSALYIPVAAHRPWGMGEPFPAGKGFKGISPSASSLEVNATKCLGSLLGESEWLLVS